MSTADEIRDLLFAYCWHLDRGEYDDVRELFVDPSAAAISTRRTCARSGHRPRSTYAPTRSSRSPSRELKEVCAPTSSHSSSSTTSRSSRSPQVDTTTPSPWSMGRGDSSSGGSCGTSVATRAVTCGQTRTRDRARRRKGGAGHRRGLGDRPRLCDGVRSGGCASGGGGRHRSRGRDGNRQADRGRGRPRELRHRGCDRRRRGRRDGGHNGGALRTVRLRAQQRRHLTREHTASPV